MKARPKILLIEDDASIVGGLKKELQAEGYEAKAARWLGVTRTTLREKLILFGLHPTGEKQHE